MRYSLLPPKSLLNLKKEMQTIQQRIKDLEKFKQIKDLETEFKMNFEKSFKSGYRRGNHSNLLSDYKEIKLLNIFLFDLEFFIKQQDK